MKKPLLLLFLLIPCFLFVCLRIHAQAGQWTWMKGDSTTNGAGSFGTQGVVTASNKPPALYEPIAWTDHDGYFWLLGGVNNSSSMYAALWKFDPSTNNWVWVKGPNTANASGIYGTQGVPAAANFPGARGWGGHAWTDSQNNLWVYGAWGVDASGISGSLSDLWKYDIATNEWTWMNGNQTAAESPVYGTFQVFASTNNPGGRCEASTTWIDASDNLYLYGGEDTYGIYGDVWKYDPTINEWAWIAGSNSYGSAVVNGTKGVFSANNTPGARMAYSRWQDGDGKFWFFGGNNYSTGKYGNLWEFDPVINQWAWISGSTAINATGKYKSKCNLSTDRYPQARYENKASWMDKCGNFWMYGGYRGSSPSVISDLWVYSPHDTAWAWVSGDSSYNYFAGFYGTQGIPSDSTRPGCKMGAVTWTDTSGNLWIFGGGDANFNKKNDLWKYVIDPLCPVFSSCGFMPLANFGVNDTALCEGACVTFTNLSGNNPTTWQWSFPGGTPSSSTDQNPPEVCYYTSGSYDVSLVVTNAVGSDTFLLSNFIVVNVAPPAPVITQSNDTLTCSAASTYQWYLSGFIIPGATGQQYIASQSGIYEVVITDSSGCSANDTMNVVLQLPQSNFSADEVSGCPGACFDFTNASLNATQYEWSFPGGNPSSSSLPNPSGICYANPGVYDVSLIASSNFASDTLTLTAYLTIYTPLTISISQSGNFLTCNPAASSYQWYLAGNIIPGATDQNLYIDQTGDYSVTVNDSNGCASTAIINVLDVPSPGFSAPNTSVCEKFCVSFIDQSTNNPTAWHWLFPGGIPDSSPLQNPANICYNLPGVYDVTLITTNIYGDDTVTLPNYITVYATPPFPTITQVGYTLTSSPAAFYQWQLNATDIPGATNQEYTILQSGYYTVIVSDSNGCENSVTEYVLISGINDLITEANISIYPNPSSGNFMVELLNGLALGEMPDEISIEVMNALGQVVFSSSEKINDADWVAGSHSKKKEIDLHYVAQGIYFIEIKTKKDGASPDIPGLRNKILIAH